MIGVAAGAIGDAAGVNIGFKTTPNIKRLLTRIVFVFYDYGVLVRDRYYIISTFCQINSCICSTSHR